MTTTRQPTAKATRKLIAFLPKLYAEGFTPVKEWHSGRLPDGNLKASWPEYDEAVERLVRAVVDDGWMDRNYHPEVAGEMVECASVIEAAIMPQLRARLTYLVRSERFGEGARSAMIRDGTVRRILERLSELEKDLKKSGS